MRIECLGTTGYHPSPSRHTACYFLPEQKLLLDAGTGLFRLVQHLQQRPLQSLDILLTHAHLDHTVGLTFLLDVMAVTELERVRLFAEQSKLDAVAKHLFQNDLFPVAPPFELIALPKAPGEVQIGDTKISFFEQEHPGNSLGYELQVDGKNILYMTDTTPDYGTQHDERLMRCDLLMHECYFSDEHIELARKTGHSWLSAVTEIVARTKPKQTLLIHVNPLAEMLKAEFDLSDIHMSLNMSIAQDEKTITV